MLYSFFLIIMKNVGRSSAFRPRYPNIYYRTFSFSKQTSSLTQSVAPPLQITTAALGCDLGTGLKMSASILLQCCKTGEIFKFPSVFLSESSNCYGNQTEANVH